MFLEQKWIPAEVPGTFDWSVWSCKVQRDWLCCPKEEEDVSTLIVDINMVCSVIHMTVMESQRWCIITSFWIMWHVDPKLIRSQKKRTSYLIAFQWFYLQLWNTLVDLVTLHSFLFTNYFCAWIKNRKFWICLRSKPLINLTYICPCFLKLRLEHYYWK